MKDFKEKLERIEREVKEGNLNLKALGFWHIVNEAKKNRDIALQYADRLGEIDRLVFEKTVPTFSIKLGLISLLIVSIISINMVFLGGLSIILSAIILYFTIHPFAHYLMGRVCGINFTHMFFNGPLKMEPNIKVDYSTYLLASAPARAIMHLSGIASSLLVVLLILIYAFLSNVDGMPLLAISIWFTVILASEVVIILTNVTGHKKLLELDFGKTDTGRAFREMRYS
jgi:hypothetical protein